jgi:hypothetical protein
MAEWAAAKRREELFRSLQPYNSAGQLERPPPGISLCYLPRHQGLRWWWLLQIPQIRGRVLTLCGDGWHGTLFLCAMRCAHIWHVIRVFDRVAHMWHVIRVFDRVLVQGAAASVITS